jgi:hypothetical protein
LFPGAQRVPGIGQNLRQPANGGGIAVAAAAETLAAFVLPRVVPPARAV